MQTAVRAKVPGPEIRWAAWGKKKGPTVAGRALEVLGEDA
jgi:hypothetical protein